MYNEEQRDDRDSEHHDSSSSSSGSHRTKIADEKRVLDTKNVIESAFFSLSSAVRSGKHKVLLLLLLSLKIEFYNSVLVNIYIYITSQIIVCFLLHAVSIHVVK